MRDPVVAADLVEQHLPALAEPVGELFAVVGDHFLRHSEPGQRLSERQTDRPAGGAFDHGGDHAEPGVVIDPGDQLRVPHLPGPGIDQLDAADDVDAPQLHRSGSFEPDERGLRPLPWPGPEQPRTDQDPVDRPLRRHRHPSHRFAQHLQPDPPRPPPRMLPAHLRHRHLHRRGRLVRARRRPVRPVRQTGQLLAQIPGQPAVYRRPVHPQPGRHLRDVRARQNRPDRVQPLLENRQDNQSHSRPPKVWTPHGDAQLRVAEPARCRTSTGGRPSHINRRRTRHRRDCLDAGDG